MLEQLIGWLSLMIYIAIVAGTVLVVLLDNRQPAKTIAWVVVLVLLPVVGLVFFYFFGQNIRKEHFISKKSLNLLTGKMLAEITTCPPEAIPHKYEPLISLYQRNNLALASSGNNLDILHTGADFIASLLKAIGSAKRHIHLETYIIEDDAVGRLISDALADKAAQGVDVRLIYDDVGCWNVPRTFFKDMADKGIMVEPFLPVKFPSLTHKINYRNHRKICIIDGSIGFIGGMNLALRYVSRSVADWHDLHMRMKGCAVAELQRIFLSDWHFITGTLITDQEFFPLPQNPTDGHNALVQVVAANPVSRYPEIMYGLTWIISHARRYLYVQTPYFMPTEPVLQALQTAAMSGVDVRIMVPQKPDGFWLRWANDSYFTEVLQAGIRIYSYQPGFIHSKLIVADDDWCSLGSSNMDFRSFENNFEANAFIYDHATATKLRHLFLSDQLRCREITLEEWKLRPWNRRLLESSTRILSPLF